MADRWATIASLQVQRRKHTRFIEPRLRLTLDGAAYATHDWSLGGFRIIDFHRAVEPGEELGGRVDDANGTSGPFHARCVWSDGRQCGFQFLELDKQVTDALTKANDWATVASLDAQRASR